MLTLYTANFEIQRDDSPMSRDGRTWPSATLEAHQERLNQAATNWVLSGYRVNYCVATSTTPPYTRVELQPQY